MSAVWSHSYTSPACGWPTTSHVSRLRGDYTADKEAKWPWAPTLLSSRTTPSKQRGRKKTSQQIHRLDYRLGNIYDLSLHIILNLISIAMSQQGATLQTYNNELVKCK